MNQSSLTFVEQKSKTVEKWKVDKTRFYHIII